MDTNDFLDELAEVALGSRLKRLSERLGADGAQVYKTLGHDVQPKWFTLLVLLHRKQMVNVMDAARLLGLTQPAISQFAKELIKQQLVITAPDATDSRRKNLSLSADGQQLVERLQPMWDAVELASKQLCSEAGTTFYQAIREFEQALERRTLLQRTMAILDNPGINPEIEVVEFQPQLAAYFDTINREWITDMFALEDTDQHMLANPQTVIIDNGGKIYFAKHPTLGIIGTCALLKKGPDCFELTKMGVTKQSRGLKVGETLLAHVISQANQMAVNELFLLTNHQCESAIHLYKKLGFVNDKIIMQRFGSGYERCDVAMRYVQDDT